jgi:hypothetical protein
MGLIYATLGEHEAAVEQFNAATGLDNYLAVASVLFSSSSTALLTLDQQQLLPMWCLKLLTRSLRPRFQGLRRGSALFTRQPIYVRNILPCYPMLLLIPASHPVIILNSVLPLNYIPLRSFLTKVIHHPPSFFRISNSFLGLALIYLGQREDGMAELQDATSQKATEEHGVIDEAIRDGGEGYTVFSIVSLFSSSASKNC